MTVATTPAALELEQVTVRLGDREVVRSADLVVEPGSWTTVIGPNGAGKTSLLRAAAGLIDATGDVRIDGLSSHSHGARRREMAQRIALMPQNPVIPPAMAVVDYVLLGRTPYLGRRLALRSSDIDIALDVMDRLDLAGFHHRMVGELSGGELQRVVIARALVQQPDVLLLDEPTTGLDLGHQQEVLELVDELRHDHLAVLATLHDLGLAAQYSDRLVLMVDGRIVATGTPDEVITEDVLARVFGANVQILRGDDGVAVVPRRR